MFFLRYRKSQYSVIFYLHKNKLKRSLQAQVTIWLQRMKKRASCSASCGGSATVEAALVFPIFLCAMAALLTLGQLLITEAKIQYALCKTADIYAIQQAVKEFSEETSAGKSSGGGKELKNNLDGTSVSRGRMWKAALEGVSLQAVFSSFYELSPMDAQCIRGGRPGISVTASKEQENGTIWLKAKYYLKIQTPFLGTYYFGRTASSLQRIFNGYEEHGLENGGGEDGGFVYVTEHGTVYHTSLSCTHICRKISGESVGRILEGSKFDACEKCIAEGAPLSVLYVTAYGEKYHSSLNCSGLKRTVRTVRKKDVGGMKICSRCAAKGGG